MTTPLVIYHGNCPDGFTAAWVTDRALRSATFADAPVFHDVELFKGVYGEDPPYELARARQTYVVDFSYPREKLLRLKDAAYSLTVLDHHKTAQADLDGLDFCTFDMNQSGAGLAWSHFYPNNGHLPRPWLVDYVEDRDLWRFALPASEAVSLWVRLTPHDLEAYDALSKQSLSSIVQIADGAMKHLHHYVSDALRNIYIVDNADGTGHAIAAVNVSYTGVSDVLHGVLESSGKQIALGWHRSKDGLLNCSLRSVTGVDCSAFAKRFGGGGHAQAAGFRVELSHPFAQAILTSH